MSQHHLCSCPFSVKSESNSIQATTSVYFVVFITLSSSWLFNTDLEESIHVLLGSVSFQSRIRVLPHHIVNGLYNLCHLLIQKQGKICHILICPSFITAQFWHYLAVLLTANMVVWNFEISESFSQIMELCHTLLCWWIHLDWYHTDEKSTPVSLGLIPSGEWTDPSQNPITDHIS